MAYAFTIRERKERREKNGDQEGMEFGGFKAEEFAISFLLSSLSRYMIWFLFNARSCCSFFIFHFDSRTDRTTKLGLQYGVEWFILKQTPFMAATSTKLS